MSKNGYNQLLESNEEVKSNNSNSNPNINSQKKVNSNYTQYNFNENNNLGGGNQYNNLMDSGYGFKSNNFQRNNPKMLIKWRNVMKVDIEAIRNTNDLSLLNTYLENFLYSTITDEDIQAVPEGNVVKLIKILQFSNEFLLSARQNLNERIISLEGQKQGLLNENQKMDDNLLKQKDYLDKEEKEKKERLRQIVDYKNYILSLIKGGIPIQGFGGSAKITDINIDINKRYNYNKTNLRGSEINGYKCRYCIGTIFSSQFELNNHLKNIHLIEPEEQFKGSKIKQQYAPKTEIKIVPPQNMNINNNLRNNNRDKFENKLNEIKMELQDYKHKYEIEMLQKQLNKKDEKNSDFEQQLKKMGSTFNDALKEMKDIFRNNMSNRGKKKKIKKIKKINYNYENDLKNDKDLNDLEKLINEKRATLNLNKREYEEKIKILNKEITDINITQNVIPKKPKNYVFEQNEQFLYPKKNVKKLGKSSRFHSGIIESDHDDTDKENKRQERIISEIKGKTKLIEIITNPSEKGTEFGDTLKFVKPQEDLDDFYKRYIKRDKKYLENATFKNYLKKVIPDKFNDDNKIENKAKLDNDEKIFRTVNYFNENNENELNHNYDIDDLKEKDIDELLQIINSNCDLMENYNNIQGENDPYYESVKDLIELKDLRKFIQNFDEKKSNLYKKRDDESIEKIKNYRLTAIETTINKNNNINKIDNDNIINTEEQFTSGNIFGTNNENNIKLKNINNTINSLKTGINNNINNINIPKETTISNITESFPFNSINQHQINNKAYDTQYTSSKHGIEQNKDVPYTSSKEGQAQNENKDVPYTSSKQGQARQKNKDVPYTSSREGQARQENKDVPYTSSKEGQARQENKDVPYTSSKEGQAQKENKDVPYNF